MYAHITNKITWCGAGARRPREQASVKRRGSLATTAVKPATHTALPFEGSFCPKRREKINTNDFLFFLVLAYLLSFFLWVCEAFLRIAQKGNLESSFFYPLVARGGVDGIESRNRPPVTEQDVRGDTCGLSLHARGQRQRMGKC